MVIPLHTGGLKTLFSKLYEKVMHRRLYNHLNLNGFFAKIQFGFRKGHSTIHTVHHLIDFANSALERGVLVLSIFIDFSKAFDTVVFKI